MLGKLNCYVVRVSIFLIAVALIASMVGCVERSPDEFAGGSGIASDPYQIANWHHLDNVRYYLGAHFILVNDLGSTTVDYDELASPTANEGKGWQPIGTEDDLFTGTFDGQGYKIRDLFINRPDDYHVALFGAVGQGGVVQNIGVVNADVAGYGGVGSLVGDNEGTVSNSYSTGSVTGIGGLSMCVGGLVGVNDDGTVSSSYATGSVTGDSYVGGLMGWNEGTVSNCYATDSVSGNFDVGGLVGRNSYGTVSNSYATGSVTGGAGLGGLMGENYGTVSDSYSTGSVTGYNDVGGLVGSMSEYGTVSNSYATGTITGESCVGGLVGFNRGGTVSNSHYNYDEVLINGENIITIGALFAEDFEEWLANDKFLDANDRLPQENGYYVVNNVTDFRELVALGQDSSLKFRLTNDLDLASQPNSYIPNLAGEFDGNGHKISNLSFNFDFVSAVGLFGFLGPGGKVNDLGAENVNITGTGDVGGLVGVSLGTVSDSYSTGSVTGEFAVGGLMGENYGTVRDSYSTGSVTGEISIGGLVGLNHYESTVSSSYATGSVDGDYRVGGLVGGNGGTASDSYSTGNVTGDDCAGGLVGANYDTVSNSYSTGSVTGYSNVGGLVGWNSGTVSNSYSTGSVSGDYRVGGLIGDNEEIGTVTNSFWDTQTSGQSTSSGGTGKSTAEMKSIATFSGAGWDIIAVANPGTRNRSYIWNIVDGQTYPFLSWQP